MSLEAVAKGLKPVNCSLLERIQQIVASDIGVNERQSAETERGCILELGKEPNKRTYLRDAARDSRFPRCPGPILPPIVSTHWGPGAARSETCSSRPWPKVALGLL